MIKLILFVGVLFTFKNAYADVDVLSCMELFNPENIDRMCCETSESFDKIGNDTIDCLKEDAEEWLCEDFECVMQKNGMLKGGKIDEDGVKKYLDDLESANPSDAFVLNRVRHECTNRQYEAYPPDVACPMMKFFVCTYVNIYLECDSWKTDETCVKMGEQARKCLPTL